jgi:protein-tyrosine phosphatase
VTHPADARIDTPGLPQLSVANLVATRVRAALIAAYHLARNLPDRILHPRRHFAAHRRVSRMDRPRSILVVCHGNICRSPYLQAVLQRALPDIAVSSAGFIGRDRRVPVISLEVSARRGIDLSRFRSQSLTPENVSRADLMIVMEPGQARYIERVFGVRPERLVIAGDLDPERGPTRAIRDPWMQSVHVFESSFDRLDRCAATLVTVLSRGAGH